MNRTFLFLLILIALLNNLKAEEIVIDSVQQAEKLADQYRLFVEDSDSNYFQCKDISFIFPSIRSDIGIQRIQLATMENNGKYSMLTRIHASLPPRLPPKPGEQLPPLTEKSRSQTYFCITDEQLGKAILIITYGYPDAMCFRDRISVHLKAFMPHE